MNHPLPYITIFKSLFKKFSRNVEIIIYNMGNHFLNRKTERYPQAAFYRILTPVFIDSERIIHLDGETITIVGENTVEQNTIRTYPQGNADDTVAKVNLPNVGNQGQNVQSSKIFFIVFSILFFAVYLYSFIKMIKDFKK